MLRRFSLLLCVLLGAAVPAQAQIQTNAKHALLMDAATGQVLWEKDGRVANPPSSMSKLMTLDLSVWSAQGRASSS
jgi:D-alanyl-D-alanine carboxypeptidase (penicillin-binding protein 5/6)